MFMFKCPRWVHLTWSPDVCCFARWQWMSSASRLSLFKNDNEMIVIIMQRKCLNSLNYLKSRHIWYLRNF
jgi:hypothetical protein